MNMKIKRAREQDIMMHCATVQILIRLSVRQEGHLKHEQGTECTQSYNHKTCREYITSQS